MAKKILVINPFGVGDVLFSTPMVSVLRQAHSGCYIGYICNTRTREILETNPDIDEVFVFERSEYRAVWKQSSMKCVKKLFDFWNTIKKRKFDTVYDLSLGKEYAFFCWFCGIRERIGFDYKCRGRFLTHKMRFNGFNDKPVSEYYLGLVPSLSGQKHSGGFKTVLVPAKEDEAYINDFLKASGVKEGDVLVGIMPGGGVSFGKKDEGRRRWPAVKFSELADKVIERYGAKVVLIWGPGEEDLVENIKRLMKNTPLVAPKTTIRQMAALCKRSSAIACSEGGPLHVASSQGVKTISIFGPVDEKVYGPYPSGKTNTVVTSDVECRPCYKRFKLPECNTKKCLEDISVQEVFEALEVSLQPRRL